ncbi:signal peptidase II [Arthrobacter sp. NPDC058288]|uniref:signal peptidase II n=1 Tax=Arthrobacter sp. NPDC058288 TaxID=3346424 RepID=UPI0036E7EF80
MSVRVPGRLLPVRTVLALTAVGLAALDLLIKAFVMVNMSDGRVLDYGVFTLRLAYNTGVAFSLGASLSPWIVAAATAALVAVLAVFLLRKAPHLARIPRSGAALLLGGALGNLVDRLDGAGVVDYLHTGWFPTFNLADVFVVGGAVLLVIGSMRASSPAQEEA